MLCFFNLFIIIYLVGDYMSQYFENDKSVKSNRKLINFSFNDREYYVYTDNGVFSKDRFDYGTKVLLENININNLCGKVLDLGCGIGVAGIILGTINKDISIDMIDVNERALELAKENILLNKVKANVFISNVYDKVTSKYDCIITNPPIRAGKNVVRKFLLEAEDYLNDEGILYFVMRKDHGVKSMIKELEDIYNVKIIDRDKGFYVIRCNKKI